MIATHQIDDTFLTAYAAGSLPEAFSVVVAAQVSLCDATRARLETAQALGGAVLEEIAAVPMASDSLAATMRLIARDPAPQDQPRIPCAVLPAPVTDYLGGGLADVKWRPLGMGAKQAVLKKSKEGTVRLLYIPAGAAMPDHGHHGTEMTLVLQGAFVDGEQRFARGDIEVADESLHHTPVAEAGAPCICLVASDARLKFNGIIPRLVQPFLGI